MKLLKMSLIGLLVLTISSCAKQNVVKEVKDQDLPLTKTPVELVRQNLQCSQTPTPPPTNFTVLRTREWSQGVVVLYKADCPSSDGKATPQQIAGYRVVKGRNLQWQLDDGGYSTYTPPSPSTKTTEIVFSQGELSQDSSIIEGHVLSSKVAAVEATFNNGQIVRDDQIIGGVFLLIGPELGTGCELRLLDPNNQVLSRQSLEIKNNSGRECPSSAKNSRQ